ncbi:hypothetical protein HHI36_004375 [Cryptolaemus montrouzieri]|uniref:Timeless n=1 Tax=Cryptolaemus montrouzieri TaxID=559131 RepID=A0ABD2NRT8_9CUCU
MDCTIRLLVNLTIPIEYLLPLDMIQGSDVGKHSIYELNNLLSTCKEAFSDGRSTKAIMDHIKQIIESDGQLTVEDCDTINNCLLLLRNILHIPENNSSTLHSTMQNQIVWNLFTQSIDKIIIFLVSCPQKLFWSITMVQLIALLYKDQHVGNLQKLLNLWLEASLSESSEDNESNTSAPCQGSDDSSPLVTSDPTSDSSDAGGGLDVTKVNGNGVKENRNTQTRNKSLSEIKRVQSTETEASTTSSGVSSMISSSHSNLNKSQTSLQSDQIIPSKKRECPSSTSEVSDCGYGTQVGNQEFVSTSSNDDDQPSQKPIHLKPHTFQKTRYNTGKKTTTALEKKELRRKKLVKRSKTNTIKMKGLMHHLPTDEDISNVLKEFTVDFLLKGYGTLVRDLHAQLLSNIYLHIDTSHFFWLVTYFLKFATQLELDLDHLNPVLSYDLLSYLVFQGAWVLEELEIKSKMMYMDLRPCLRRLHLVVTAIREFLQAVETYQKMIHLSDEDRNYLLKLQLQIAETQELGSLFILLLRQYNFRLQSKQYLQDVILTNHNFLMFLDNASKGDNVPKISLMEHLKKFAAAEIMCQYGILLESFTENGEFINNCIFTMMHHIGGDLENVSILFQPSILKVFSQIWEMDFELCDDWADLIEYVIHKFINTPRASHCIPDKNSDGVSDAESTDNSDKSEWTREEKDTLLRYYNQSYNSPDVIRMITKKYKENGMTHRTQISVIKELLLQNIINENQFKDFVKIDQDQPKDVTSMDGKNEKRDVENNWMEKSFEDLRCYLMGENRGKCLVWLKEILQELCYAKLLLENPTNFKSGSPLVEPTIYNYSLLNLPIPLIPWTSEQNTALKVPAFVILLRKLGFHLPIDTGKIFVRIPNFWTADIIYGKVEQLGTIDKNELKFDPDLLNNPKKNCTSNIPKHIKVNCMEQAKFFTIQRKHRLYSDIHHYQIQRNGHKLS